MSRFDRVCPWIIGIIFAAVVVAGLVVPYYRFKLECDRRRGELLTAIPIVECSR